MGSSSLSNLREDKPVPSHQMKYIVINFKIALLRHNSYTIQFTHLKTIQINDFKYIHRVIQPPAKSILEHFINPKRKF